MTDTEAKRLLAAKLASTLRKHEEDSLQDFAGMLHDVAKKLAKREGKCRSCGQKNRWPSTAKDVRCGRCGLPIGV